MTRIVYVNGAYQRYEAAAIHVEDRGFQFADSIYEVIEVRDRQLVDATRHLARLQRSLRELAIAQPMSDAALLHVIRRVIARNRVRDGVIYLQVSRGAGPRNFAFPDEDTAPSLIVIARAQPRSLIEETAETGIWVKTMPDIRWRRSDIKTVMLLPACLAKDAARREGAGEAWFVDDEGYVTEGASSNAWIVTTEGRLRTRQTDERILSGVTRLTTRDVARTLGLTIEDKPFTVEEAMRAHEAFVTSASNGVMPVVAIDGETIGNGSPGPISRQLRAKFHEIAELSDE